MTIGNSSSNDFILFFTGYIPKIYTSQYILFGLSFSEKSWIYLIAIQLLLSQGIQSFTVGLCGLVSGYIYDRDGFGFQSYRLPKFIEVGNYLDILFYCIKANFFTSNFKMFFLLCRRYLLYSQR